MKFSFELLVTLYLSILQQIIKEWGFWFSVYCGKIYLNSLIKEIKKENRFYQMQNLQNTKVQRMFLNDFFFVMCDDKL